VSYTPPPAYRPVHYAIPEDLKTDRATYSASPNNRGLDGAAARIRELFRVDVTASFVKLHTEQTRKLAYHKISGNRWYSDRDLFDLIVVGTRQDDGQAVGA